MPTIVVTNPTPVTPTPPLTAGDTGSFLYLIATNPDGSVLPFVSAEVEYFSAGVTSGSPSVVDMTNVDASGSGTARYDFQTGELVPGDLSYRYKIIFADGRFVRSGWFVTTVNT